MATAKKSKPISAKKSAVKASAAKKLIDEEPKAKLSQQEFPIYSLDSALRIARALYDNFAGKSAAPHRIAQVINMTPTSGPWRSLCGSAMAYGLTDGGYNAAQIALTELGRRIVAPTEEGADVPAKVEAVLRPRVQGEFFRRYDRAKFPKEVIAQNVLVDLGLSKEKAAKALDVLLENGKSTGIIYETKTGPFVALEVDGATIQRVTPPEAGESDGEGDAAIREVLPTGPSAILKAPVARVFITHGKNKKILSQVKEIVTYGSFEPVVAQEHETISKPVPDKVMDDMRSCQAAVIHVSSEGVLTDEDGNLQPKVNGNVLIEIGAAMALYGRKFILLVEEGVKLPSNLQGLYECRYQGDSLDGTSTMKLLKAFNEFK